ncbi:MAG: vWA domain-containing protein [Anaerolineae bacterium]|nr:vWA domain-containing protein [Anaerolineae bacterium]
MAHKDDLESLREKAGQRARLAAELGRARQAFRSLRFRKAAEHLQNALELRPDDRAIRRRLRFARFASWFQYVALLLVVAAVGLIAFLAVTQWGPALRASLAPTPAPRPTPTPTNTPVIRTPSPTPTRRPTSQVTLVPAATADIRVELMSARTDGQKVSAEFRVLESGSDRTKLRTGDFQVWAEKQQIPFQVEERDADDPVCVIVVVDNSGSIIPGLERIRAAIRGLNERRKPGDQLGLVLFAEPNRVEVKQPPSDAPLNDRLVNGEGQLTALWDGILKGIELARTCSLSERYLIVMTDGADNASVVLKGDDRERAQRIAQMAQAENLGICTVGVQSESLREEPLQIAAYRCPYSSTARFSDLVSLFQNIFGFVRHFYRLEINAESLPPGTESVTLRVLNAAELRIELPK